MKKIIATLLFCLSATANPTTFDTDTQGNLQSYTNANATQTYEEIIHAWEENINPLDNDELHLIANILCLGHSFMSVDSYLRRCANGMTPLIMALKSDIIRAEQNHIVFRQFQELTTTIAPLLEKHYTLSILWQNINSLLDQPKWNRVAYVINDLQVQIELILEQNLAQNNANLDSYLLVAQETSASTAQAIHRASETFAALRDGNCPTNPALLDPNMAKLDSAFQISTYLQEHLLETSLATLNLFTQAEALQETGLQVFADCYEILYKKLTDSGITPISLMIDGSGLLAEQKRGYVLLNPTQMVANSPFTKH